MIRRNLVDKFLSPEAKSAVKQAITEAESQTSGEIVVRVTARSVSPLRVLWALLFEYISPRASIRAAVEKKATAAFLKLGIQQTEGHTGVLIYISLQEKMVVIRADHNIDMHVQAQTWQMTVDLILEGIKSGQAAQGICNAVKQLGKVLASYYPRKADDKNELSDDVVT